MSEQSHSPDIEKWLSLIRSEGVGPVNFRKLIKQLGSLDAVLGASVAGLVKVEDIGQKTAERLVELKLTAQKLRDIGRTGAVGGYRHAGRLVDDDYPVVFKQNREC